MLLIPMLISTLFATFLPDFFKIGGMTEGFFTTKGINYIVALVCFCSSAALDTVIFYVISFPLIWLFETKVLKEDGIITFRITSIAGLSVSVPTIIAAADPNIAEIASVAVAQIVFGVMLTSIITPILAEKYAKKHNIQKRSLNM